MPITIKPQSIKYRDSTTNTYKSIDIVGEAMTFDAQAYGTGKRNGVNVTSGDTAYHNNAKYYMEQAQSQATAAATSATQAAASADRFTITVDNNHGLVFHLT